MRLDTTIVPLTQRRNVMSPPELSLTEFAALSLRCSD